MERGMVRRPSTTDSTESSGCEVTFDDVDDSHVFAYLDEGDEHGSMKPAASRSVEFRLDFSSRVNPTSSLPPTSSSSPLTRRSSTNSLVTAIKRSNSAGTAGGRVLQRSPSMRSNTVPFRKRLSRRPSEPVPDTIISAAVAMAASVRRESPPPSPVSPASPPRTPSAPVPAVAPSAKPSVSPSSKSHAAPADDAVAAAHGAAMTAAASEINRLQTENETLREELDAARSNAAELSERIRLAAQQYEALSDQFIAVQEAYEDKLRSAYEEATAEREESNRQRETELQALRDRSEEERVVLEREMKTAVAKIESELQSDADQLQRLLRDGKDQTNALKAQIAKLQSDLKASNAEKHHLSQADASFATKYESLQRSADHWEEKCRSLEDQVHRLLHEQEEWRRREVAEKQASERKHALHKAIQERFLLQVQVLQSQLKALATGTQELIKTEVRKTTQLVARLQQQASEVAIQHNEKAMALVAKQNRIIQLETQLKNERQSVVQLDASLAKTTRTMQKKDETFRSKYHEQKEFLDITVAVRNGLTNELQNKKKKLEDLEIQLREAVRAREAVEKKNKHLLQQVKVMQQVHAREMEQVALARQHQQQSIAKRRNSLDNCSSDGLTNSRRLSSKGTTAPASSGLVAVAASYKFSSLRRNSNPMVVDTIAGEERGEREGERGETQPPWLPNDVPAAEEWRDFVELVALHEAECRYQQEQHAPQ